MLGVSRRTFLSLSLAALASLGIASCATPTSTPAGLASITAVGSTALQPLVEAAAERYMEQNPNVQINVQGGGSGQGITQIAQGAVQIGNSDVFAEEKIQNMIDTMLKDNRVCVVGMAPVVNPDVEVDDLTVAQLRNIFTGKTTNWKDLGGADQPIVVINRAAGSGTRATFERAILGDEHVAEDFAPQEQDSSGTVVKMVSQTPGSISYLAFNYLGDAVKPLKVDGVEPTAQNVQTNDWTIWAYEHMYTAAEADAATQAFIDYILSDEVQGSLVEETGYIPVAGMQVERDVTGTVTRR